MYIVYDMLCNILLYKTRCCPRRSKEKVNVFVMHIHAGVCSRRNDATS